MRIPLVLSVIGELLRVFSLAFLVPIVMAIIDGAWMSLLDFAIALVITAATGFALTRLFTSKTKQTFTRLEAMGVVALSWLAVAAFGCIPYLFVGLSPVNAYFESMSGFTTTGATILTDFSLFDRPFYIWRAMTQWFGGLGVIALFVVMLPRLGIAGRQLFFQEASSAPGEGISPKVHDASLRLWLLYSALTLILVVLLVIGGMSVYEGFCHAFTTLSAGGFSPNGESIAGYHNPFIEWILVLFMLIGGTSYTLQYKAYTRKPTALIRDGEFLFYAGVCIIGALFVALLLADGLPNEANFRAAFFQSASLISSTGFASTDYNLWADAVKVVLVVIMVVGGCAGSAAGGPKSIRYLLVGKHITREIMRTIHPHAVLPIKYKGEVIQDKVLRAVFTLVVLYIIGYFILGVLVTVIDGVDLATGFSVSLACLGNIGPGFGPAGPMGNFDGFTTLTKILLIAAMWIGRLEIVTILALLHPHSLRNLRLRSGWH